MIFSIYDELIIILAKINKISGTNGSPFDKVHNYFTEIDFLPVTGMRII